MHLSVLGVVDDPKLGYLRSKARGEQLVRESSLDWVVLRPSLMFGVGDGFFNIVKTTLRFWSPGIVAIPGSGDTRSNRSRRTTWRSRSSDPDRCGTVPDRSTRSVDRTG